MELTTEKRMAMLSAAYGQKAIDKMVNWDQMGQGPHIIWINDAPVASGCMLVIEGFSLFKTKLKELKAKVEMLMKNERKGTLAHKAMKERLGAIAKAMEISKSAGKTGQYVDVARCHNCDRGSGVTSKEKKLQFLTCARCRCVYYCDKFCQKKHWPKHRKDCDGNGGRNTHLTYDPERIRTILQAIGRDVILHGTCYALFKEFTQICRPAMAKVLP